LLGRSLFVMSSSLITDTFKQAKSRPGKSTQHKKQVDSKKDQDVKKTRSSTDKKGDEQLSSDIEVLRDFDLQLDYGPCIGIARLERWDRAEKFGLNPPMQVRKIIEMNLNDDRYTQCVWNDYNI